MLQNTEQLVGCHFNNQDFNITSRLCCRYEITGFPTIKFFSKTNKDGENVSQLDTHIYTQTHSPTHTHIHTHTHAHTHTHSHTHTHTHPHPHPHTNIVILFMSFDQYERGRTTADFVKFLNEKCGTKRLPGGDLSDDVRILHGLVNNQLRFYSCCKVTRSFKTLLSLHLRIITRVSSGGGGTGEASPLNSQLSTNTCSNLKPKIQYKSSVNCSECTRINLRPLKIPKISGGMLPTCYMCACILGSFHPQDKTLDESLNLLYTPKLPNRMYL